MVLLGLLLHGVCELLSISLYFINLRLIVTQTPKFNSGFMSSLRIGTLLRRYCRSWNNAKPHTRRRAATKLNATAGRSGPRMYTTSAGITNINVPKAIRLMFESKNLWRPSSAPRRPLVSVVGMMPNAVISNAKRAGACSQPIS